MSNSSNGDGSNVANYERPADILAGVAADAWQAYNAMETTKQRHYGLLEIVENKKKKFNLDPTERDTTVLAHLLTDHDEQVKRFTAASKLLKNVEPDAHRCLFEYIGMLNQSMEGSPLH